MHTSVLYTLNTSKGLAIAAVDDAAAVAAGAGQCGYVKVLGMTRPKAPNLVIIPPKSAKWEPKMNLQFVFSFGTIMVIVNKGK